MRSAAAEFLFGSRCIIFLSGIPTQSNAQPQHHDFALLTAALQRMQSDRRFDESRQATDFFDIFRAA